MRSKEFANDYRYFPEPDLLPVILESNFIEEVKQNLPELLEEKKIRFMNEFELSDYDADVLVADKGMASYYENVVQLAKNLNYQQIGSWVICQLK